MERRAMTWGSWENFWAMGGYAPFVWGAYAITFGALLLELLAARARGRQARAAIQQVTRNRRQGTGEGSGNEGTA